MATFFIATPLGAEQIAYQELQQIWPQLLAKDLKPHVQDCPEGKFQEGGFEVETDYFVGIQLNFFLKTANRVLLRLAEFRVRDLPKLYNKILSLPWIEYISGPPVSYKVAASQSRLNNEKRILDSVQSALETYCREKKLTQASELEIFVRIYDDQCTLSLNTSGEHLHKRGWMIERGEAPLRETIAARMLKEIEDLFDEGDILLDPMMGSGTLLLEGRSLGCGNFSRTYGFQFIKKTPKIFNQPLFPLNYKKINFTRFAEFRGFDIEAKMLFSAQNNFTMLEKSLQKAHPQGPKELPLKVAHVDSVRMSGDQMPPKGVIMVCNPPYGERLGEAAASLQDLLEAFARYEPRVLGVLYPESKSHFRAPKGYKLHKKVRINNGGIPCLFSVLTHS